MTPRATFKAILGRVRYWLNTLFLLSSGFTLIAFFAPSETQIAIYMVVGVGAFILGYEGHRAEPYLTKRFPGRPHRGLK